MTTQAVPDPSVLTSWDEAFQYPLPTVRKLSMRLRKDIDDHRSRLRSLVGASYRDLLGTAERIVEMDKQIQTVERGLGDIGRRCNSRLLERSDSNYTKLERTWSERESQNAKLRTTAQCKILAATLNVVSRMIRSRGDCLQATKLVILARLIWKSLSDANASSDLLGRYRQSITSLRLKLLAYIDQKLGQSDLSTDGLTGPLSAYALLSSSSAAEVLRHLLDIRTSRLRLLAVDPSTSSMLEALHLYMQTFTMAQSVFPRKFAESITAASRTALLVDKHITSVQELNLDIYGHWLAGDVRSYRMSVSTAQLLSQDGEVVVQRYSKDGKQILLQGLRKCLDRFDQADMLLDMRKEVMGAYISVGTRTKMQIFDDHFEDFRQVFVQRLEQIVTQSAQLTDFDKAVGTIYPMQHTQSIWSLAEDDIDLSSGSIHFRQGVLNRRTGLDTSYERVLAPLCAWRGRVEVLWSNVEAMRATRWGDYVELEVEDGADDELPSFQETLSKEDPNRLQDRLHADVRRAVQSGFAALERSVKRKDYESQFHLRLLRELHKQQHELSRVIGQHDAVKFAHIDLVQTSHVKLAEGIADRSIDSLKTAYSRRQFIPEDLWEGSPKLPLQPLPATFGFVMTLQQEMTTIGEDVWSAAAVMTLQQVLRQRLMDVLIIQHVNTKPEVNGGTERTAQPMKTSDEADSSQAIEENTSPQNVQSVGESGVGNATADVEEVGQSIAQHVAQQAEDVTANNVQRLFDVYYLARVLNITDTSWTSALELLESRTALDQHVMLKLNKNAAEYWRKTYLLFGLLAHTTTSYNRHTAALSLTEDKYTILITDRVMSSLQLLVGLMHEKPAA